MSLYQPQRWETRSFQSSVLIKPAKEEYDNLQESQNKATRKTFTSMGGSMTGALLAAALGTTPLGLAGLTVGLGLAAYSMYQAKQIEKHGLSMENFRKRLYTTREGQKMFRPVETFDRAAPATPR